MPLHMKKNLLLGHGWHLTGNSLKWVTISYPVIWCDSPLNSTLNRCTFPIYIQNHSTFSFHQHGSSEGQVITIMHAVKGSVPGNHKDLWPRLLIPLSLCPLYLHEPISPPRQGSACSPSHSRAAITGGSSGKLSRVLPHRMLFPRSFPFLRMWSHKGSPRRVFEAFLFITLGKQAGVSHRNRQVTNW